MKNLKIISLIIFFLIILIYVTNITAIPDKIILFKDESLTLDMLFGINIDESDETREVLSNLNNKEFLEKKKYNLKLFNFINIKKLEVNTIPKTKVIPIGNSVRIKIIYKWCISYWDDRNSRRKTI